MKDPIQKTDTSRRSDLRISGTHLPPILKESSVTLHYMNVKSTADADFNYHGPDVVPRYNWRIFNGGASPCILQEPVLSSGTLALCGRLYYLATAADPGASFDGAILHAISRPPVARHFHPIEQMERRKIIIFIAALTLPSMYPIRYWTAPMPARHGAGERSHLVKKSWPSRSFLQHYTTEPYRPIRVSMMPDARPGMKGKAKQIICSVSLDY